MSKRQQLQKQAEIDDRKHLYTLLAIGKEQLHWDDEFYYGIWLPMQGASKTAKGRYSASTLSTAQLKAAVERMKDSGFTPKANGKKFTHSKPDWRSARIAKLNALWCELTDTGKVSDKSQAAMEAWCKRHTKKDRLQWAGSAELNTCIEMLKQWLERVVEG